MAPEEAVQLTVAEAFPALAVTLVGAFGGTGKVIFTIEESKVAES